MKNNDSAENGEEMKSVFSHPNLILVNLVILVIFLLLVAGVYLWVVKKNKGQVIFPAGINYLAPQTTSPGTFTYLYDFTKLGQSTDWTTLKGKIYPFSFQYPKAMAPLTFTGDKTDAVAFKISQIPPEQSLIFVMETISERDKTLVDKPEEYVRNYWKFFSGLKALKKISDFTNEKGLVGYKASYMTKANTITNDYYFFKIEGDSDHLLHFSNIFPADGQTLFTRMLNSLEYNK